MKKPKTASEFLDDLTELFSDVSHMTTEEIEKELKEDGIDTKKAIAETKAMVQRYFDKWEKEDQCPTQNNKNTDYKES